MNNITSTIIYSAIAGAATVAGIYLVLAKVDWVKKNITLLISFSAGVLLSTAVGHLLPEGQELSQSALLWFLVSFIFFYIVEHGIIMHSCREKGSCEVHPIDTIALLGIGFHSILDGFVIGFGFEVSYTLGIIATLSVLLHELPEGITTMTILLHSGYERKKAIFYSWLVALATPLGAIGGLFLAGKISEPLLGVLLSFAAGSFFYVAASDLIPEIHKKSHFYNIVLIILGLVFPFLVELILH